MHISWICTSFSRQIIFGKRRNKRGWLTETELQSGSAQTWLRGCVWLGGEPKGVTPSPSRVIKMHKIIEIIEISDEMLSSSDRTVTPLQRPRCCGRQPRASHASLSLVRSLFSQLKGIQIGADKMNLLCFVLKYQRSISVFVLANKPQNFLVHKIFVWSFWVRHCVSYICVFWWWSQKGLTLVSGDQVMDVYTDDVFPVSFEHATAKDACRAIIWII